MSDSKEIAFSDSIIEEVAKDLGMSKDKISYHLDFMVHWIKFLTRIPTVLSIYFPHIGTMYLNWTIIEREVEYFSKLPEEEMSNSWKKRLKDNKIRLEKFRSEFKDEGKYIRHKKRQKLFNIYHTKGKNLEELEIWQNKQ